MWELRHSLDRLLRTFPVRTCTTNVFHKAQLTGRPCLFASIGKCSAPCVNRIEADEHRRLCEQLVGVMTGRLGRPYIAQLTRDMKEASAELEFEKAARLRDQIQMLETVVQQNAVVFDQDVDADVFGFASDELEASVHAFYVRAGSIRGERNWSVERVEDIDDADLMADLLVQVYSDAAGDNHPQSAATISTNREAIGVPVEPARREELEGWLTNLRGGAVTIRVASRGDKKQLMDRANENASQALQRSKMSRISDMGARTQAMNDVAKALGLAEAPLRIECYDISNTVGGAFQVASMVVFEDAIAKKSEYRRFAIRGKDGKGAVDDLSALYETLTRRFKHGNIAGDSGESIDAEQRVASAAGKMTTAVAAETIAANGNDNGEGGSDISGKGHAVPVGVQNDARESPPDIVQQNTNRHHFAYKPNLVGVDGGKPQVMAAAKALEDCGVNDVAVCGLAKRLEEVWVPDDDYPIILKRQSEGMYLLQRVRDESHRFAITYHRQQRRKGALRSALDEIPGIGESYQKRLLNHFGSVKAMREASVEDFEKVKGIGHAKAEALYTALHEQ